MLDKSSMIVGGVSNTICGSDYASIAGGLSNSILAAKYSAILGGANSRVSHDYAAVFGAGLVSCACHTFHVECLNAINSPLQSSASPEYPSGTIFRYNAAYYVPTGACPLNIIP